MSDPHPSPPAVTRRDPGPEAWLQGLGEYEGADVRRVSELLPPGYDAYLRVLHAFVPWFGDGEARPDHALPRWTWRELAEASGAEYGPHLMAHALASTVVDGTPMVMVSEGELDPVSRAALFRTLAQAGPDDARALFWFGLGAVVTRAEPPLLEAPVAAVEAVLERVRRDVDPAVVGPERAWPEDRSWVVATETDLASTYVACSDDVAERLRATPELEVMAVMLATRIDEHADHEDH